MRMDDIVYLVTALSDPDLLRGDTNKLFYQAQANEHFGFGFTTEPFISRDWGYNVNFVFLQHTQFTLVIFPGSKMVSSDWTTETGNFRIDQVPYLDGKVHEGFYNKVSSYWHDLILLLNQRPSVKVVFAGHSRGGSCAVIAALRFVVEMQQTRERLAAVVTIGQPRCVNESLAATIDRLWEDRYIRIVTSTDIVPRTPPKGCGYEHAGCLWLYDKDGNLTKNPARLEKRQMIRNDKPKIGEINRKRDKVKAVVERGVDAKRGHDIKCYEQRVHDVNAKVKSRLEGCYSRFNRSLNTFRH